MTRTKPGDVNLDLGYCNPGVNGDPSAPAECRDIIGSVYSTRREVVVRQVHQPRSRSRALRKSASVRIGGTGRRSATSAQPGHRSREAGLEESTTPV